MNQTIKRVLRFIYYLPWTVLNRINYIVKGCHVEKGHETFGLVIVKNKGTLTMGKNVRINSTRGGHPIGIGYKSFIKVKKNASLCIGDNTRLSNVSIVAADSVQIGNNVRLGADVRIYDTDFHSLDPYERTSNPETGSPKTKPIRIDDYAFIGAGSIILKGVHIGKAAVIGAGSIVTKDIPQFEIWAGNPAKKIGDVKIRSTKETND